ncbi:YjdF family protein [Paenibacillus sp. SI8]|uniref:YjdF family protein n=1 Tax=unclassified Paenibacillus TaxID=185978 RepID=UPI003467A07F
MKLTVYFEQPFWVGVIEEACNGKLRAARYVFGSEPHDAEVMAFVQNDLLDWIEHVRQSADIKPVVERRINPKRLARAIAKEMKQQGASSAAQQAIQLELELRKKERKIVSREQKEAAKELRRDIARVKAKAKHRGR